MNWTLANAGTTRNMIPPGAQAVADVRVLRVADYDGIEKRVRERDQEAAVARGQGRDEFRAPPAAARGNRRVARARQARAGRSTRELGKELVVDDVAEGGGTDAAFAALNTKAPVIERFGLQGYRRPLRRRGIRAARLHRAAPLSARAHDHGRIAGEDFAGAVSRIYKLGFDNDGPANVTNDEELSHESRRRTFAKSDHSHRRNRTEPRRFGGAIA